MAEAKTVKRGGGTGSRLRWLLASTVAIGVAPEAALAQAAPPVAPVRGSVEPTREEVEVSKPQPAAPQSRVNIDQRKAFEVGACPLRDSTVRVDLQTVRYVASAGETLAPELANLLAGIVPATRGEQSIASV